ncbi:MAG: alkaline phosphatase [Bacteroidota bacterium]
MKQILMQKALLILVTFLLPATTVWGQPKNVILMIGDGMGLSQLSAAYYYGDEEPAFDRFRTIGLVRTSSGSDPVTQSSAAATAMATGVKTYNQAIGVDMDTVARKNIVELMSGQGYMTGVIATSSVTDATPAGFYAHQPDRSQQYEIATDLLQSEIDFFAGGGIKYFLDTTQTDRFKEHGIEVNYNRLKRIRKPRPGSRYGYLLAADRMPTMKEGRKDFLMDASGLGIGFLSSGDSGFFLMIEGSQIDWAGHGNQFEYLVNEMNDFERTVSMVLDWAEADGETLVIVTADHETGGFTLGAAGTNGYDADYSTIEPTFATTNHSAAMVPLFAFGPGAESFGGLYENTEIFHKLVSLFVEE